MQHEWPLTNDQTVRPTRTFQKSTDAAPPRPAAAPEPQPALGRQVSPLELRTAYILSAALLSVAALLTPFAHIAWPPMPGFIVSYMTGLIMLDLLVGLLLLSKGRTEGDQGNVLLAGAYFYAAMVLVPYIAVFPDAFGPGTLLRNVGSDGWLWVFWHVGFAVLVIRYALSSPAAKKRVPNKLGTILSVLLLSVIAAVVALTQAGHLPKLGIAERLSKVTLGSVILLGVLAVNLLATLAAASRFRFRRIEDLWLTVGMLGACADIWLTLHGGHRYSLGWYCGRMFGFSTSFVLFMFLMNDVLMEYRWAAARNDVLDHLSLTDALTKLGNRRMFDRMLQNEWRRCRRDQLPLAIVLLDVDNFKSFNDAYGHQAGDRCLQKIAGRLADAAARAGDLAVRYGGEEFALILPATDQAGAEHLARHMRMMVRGMGIIHSGSDKNVVTISAGLASVIPSESNAADELVRLADLALYQAKANGRDTVAVAAA